MCVCQLHLARKSSRSGGCAHDNLSMGLDMRRFLPSCQPAPSRLPAAEAGAGAYQKHIRHCPAAPFGLTSSSC